MSNTFTIVREDTAKGGSLILTMPGREGTGKMTFTNVTPRQRSVDHTFVDETLGGTGAGKALATRMVEMAREDGVYLIPICPFFRATAKKHPEWHDVVQMPKDDAPEKGGR